MASMVSKLVRAAFATRASPSAVGGRPAAAISGSPAEAISVSPADAISVSPAEAISISPAEAIRVSPEEGPTEENGYRCPPVDENVFKSKEAMWAFYEYWCKYHGISRDRCEMTRRFKSFSASARIVYKVNNSGGDVELAMNRLADATKEERNSLRGYRRAKK